MPVQCICQQCGASFTTLASRIARGDGKYCSIACRTDGQRKHVDLRCQHCGAAFQRKPWEVASGEGKYCSRACYFAAKQSRNSERICETCGKAFVVYHARSVTGSGPARFCSAACYHAAKRRPLADRFWPKVDTSGECWVWTGGLHSTGYGKMGVDGKTIKANRVAWQLTHGEIPDGMMVCHRCDNPLCVRPDHLFLGTHSDNMRDMVAKGRGRWDRQRQNTNGH